VLFCPRGAGDGDHPSVKGRKNERLL